MSKIHRPMPLQCLLFNFLSLHSKRTSKLLVFRLGFLLWLYQIEQRQHRPIIKVFNREMILLSHVLAINRWQTTTLELILTSSARPNILRHFHRPKPKASKTTFLARHNLKIIIGKPRLAQIRHMLFYYNHLGSTKLRTHKQTTSWWPLLRHSWNINKGCH